MRFILHNETCILAGLRQRADITNPIIILRKGTPALIARQYEIPETLTFLVLILVLVEVALREGRSQ